jgi:CheY-like chemotaxis protein
VSVSDSGVGMDQTTLSQLFEPFFTTKPVGKGTGLGMAMVYGLMEQHGGQIGVESEPDKGTTVHLYLPIIRSARHSTDGAEPCVARANGKETVLLVEDEEMLRRAAYRVLEGEGYVVLAAPDGREALEVYGAHSEDVDLVVSDVVMPNMGGRELFATVHAVDPTMPFLFVSGHTGLDGADRALLDSGHPFLEKPWTRAQLLGRVREVLDGRSSRPFAPIRTAETEN